MKCVLLCAALLYCSIASADESLALLPASIKLTGPEARQTLIVESISAGKAMGGVTADAKFSSSDEKVVRIDGTLAIPVGNGTATISATSGNHTATASVTVDALDKPFAWSFRNHVEPVLAKAGCNSGACHGALAGKKGFKLSLAGFDAVGDYFYITRQARSRRISLEDPGRSLLLTKPTAAIPHKGGQR